MPSYGPWVQPADATATSNPLAVGTRPGSWLLTSPDLDGFGWGAVFAGTYADSLLGDSVGLLPTALSFASIRTGRTARWHLNWVYFPVAPPLPWPDHVTGVDYETPFGTPTTDSTQVNVTTTLRALDNAEVCGFTFRRCPDSEGASTWHTPTDLAAMGTLATFGPPPTNGSVSDAQTFTVSGMDTDGRAWIVAALDFIVAGTGITGGNIELAALTMSASRPYRPPRYRFIYSALPRLRQWPRDDFLGGVSRQEGSRSVQASPRQGWGGSYR